MTVGGAYPSLVAMDLDATLWWVAWEKLEPDSGRAA